jgi:hypothetical protein
VETSLQHTGRGGVCCLVEPTINLGVLTGADDRTQVWADGKRVFALGPRTAEVREKLARWHRVQEAEWPAEWKRLTREGANPWLLLETVEDDGSELVARLRPMLGQAIDPFRHALAEWARQRMSTMAEVVKKPPRGRAVRPDAAAERAARAEIARLVDRGSADDERSVRFHFTLERLQRCPLRVVPAAEGERLHAWADLGAGHVVELLVRGLDGPPVPPRWQASGTYGDDLDDRAATEWYEAGDCCCFLWSWEARNLEGVALPARDRRRREADAADDDD